MACIKKKENIETNFGYLHKSWKHCKCKFVRGVFSKLIDFCGKRFSNLKDSSEKFKLSLNVSIEIINW